MKKSRIWTNVFLSVFALVAIFCLMARGFGHETFGSSYLIIFTEDNSGYNPVVPLIIAWVMTIACVILPWLGLFSTKKATRIFYLVTALIGIAAGVLFLCAVQLFLAANPKVAEIPETLIGGLGGGFISAAIFSFLAGAVGLLGTYLVGKEEE